MSRKPATGDGYLSKREQQIMELVYEREHVTANDLVDLLPGEPSNSTVRTLLRILETKGQLFHVELEGKFVYSATTPRPSAARTALSGVVKTFFRGSVSDVMATLISEEGASLSDEELSELEQMIRRAKEEGR
ncbi:MAG TPA: BlaI/MecI/CopY family transcriptional regulator [Fimbriimonadaceae bacterium]|nr:BlaI/MecI/CopY family transcriptional regulator [Fimbriimonadaceae bacterium]